MPRLLRALAGVPLVGMLLTSPVQAEPDPLTCAGYPQPRVFLEAQSWWVRTPGGAGVDYGHVHVGTCFPHAQVVSGIVEFDVRLMLHRNPGTLHRLDVGVVGAGVVASVPFDLACAETCEQWVRVQVDTAALPVDGPQELRFRARVREPDGQQMANSTGWRLVTDNGRQRVAGAGTERVTARGWYEQAGYANAAIEGITTRALAGVWRPYVRLVPGPDGAPVTAHSIHLDPALHADDPGRVIREGRGEFEGNVAIDTRFLTPGAHQLLLRSDSDQASGSTLSGVMVIQFTVDQAGGVVIGPVRPSWGVAGSLGRGGSVQAGGGSAPGAGASETPAPLPDTSARRMTD